MPVALRRLGVAGAGAAGDAGGAAEAPGEGVDTAVASIGGAGFQSVARTWLACPEALTLRHSRSTVPSAAMRKVLRSTPM
jgi:hypothetical protein